MSLGGSSVIIWVFVVVTVFCGCVLICCFLNSRDRILSYQVLFVCFNITSFLRPGTNAIGALLGNGKWGTHFCCCQYLLQKLRVRLLGYVCKPHCRFLVKNAFILLSLSEWPKRRLYSSLFDAALCDGQWWFGIDLQFQYCRMVFLFLFVFSVHHHCLFGPGKLQGIIDMVLSCMIICGMVSAMMPDKKLRLRGIVLWYLPFQISTLFQLFFDLLYLEVYICLIDIFAVLGELRNWWNRWWAHLTLRQKQRDRCIWVNIDFDSCFLQFVSSVCCNQFKSRDSRVCAFCLLI